MLLNVENLDVSYGHAQVLHGVSLSLSEGELVCVVGRNGAGKTTLLKTIGGFMQPTSGMISFRGKRIDGLPLDVFDPVYAALLREYARRVDESLGTRLEYLILALVTAQAALEEHIAATSAAVWSKSK